MSARRNGRQAVLGRTVSERAGLSSARRHCETEAAWAQLAALGAQFDLIMADPPFGEKNVGRRSTSLSQRLLDDENLPKLLAEGGRFVLGHTKRDTLTITDAWKEVKELKHGDSDAP